MVVLNFVRILLYILSQERRRFWRRWSWCRYLLSSRTLHLADMRAYLLPCWLPFLFALKEGFGLFCYWHAVLYIWFLDKLVLAFALGVEVGHYWFMVYICFVTALQVSLGLVWIEAISVIAWLTLCYSAPSWRSLPAIQKAGRVGLSSSSWMEVGTLALARISWVDLVLKLSDIRQNFGCDMFLHCRGFRDMIWDRACQTITAPRMLRTEDLDGVSVIRWLWSQGWWNVSKADRKMSTFSIRTI